MARIAAFSGIRYNQKKIKDLKSAVTPPYDVISRTQESEFYKANKYNFIRIILGKEKIGDTRRDNKYTRAKGFFKKWLNERVFIEDKEPCVYIYEQSYNFKGKRLNRIGFISLLELEPPGKGMVFPHEKTFCKPKEDRLALLEAVEANLSPIFGLYSDRELRIDKLLKSGCSAKPVIDLKFEGVENRLWKVSDDNFIRRLAKLMQDKKIFIADGHHRYEVACFYHKLMRGSKKIKSGWTMMYFCNLESKGLKVFPTHRVIRNIAPKITEKLFLLLSRHFLIQSVRSIKELFLKLKAAKSNEHLFGLYLGKKRFYLLRLKNNQTAFSRNNPDVVILHNLILSESIGIKEKGNAEADILHTRDERLAMKLVDDREYRAAFFMNPPHPAQISAMAGLCRKMPHKSTYFYPKPLSGLVINSLKRSDK